MKNLQELKLRDFKLDGWVDKWRESQGLPVRPYMSDIRKAKIAAKKAAAEKASAPKSRHEEYNEQEIKKLSNSLKNIKRDSDYNNSQIKNLAYVGIAMGAIALSSLMVQGISAMYKHYKAKAKSKGADSRQASRVAAGATLAAVRSVKGKAKNNPKAMKRIASAEKQLIGRIRKTKKK